MNSLRNLIWRFFFASLFLTSLLAAGAPINDEDRKVLTAMADYLVPTSDQVTPFLRSIDFKPPVAEATWRQYPTVRKLETAYRMAENKKTGQGKEVLQAFYSYLAVDFDTVRSHDWPPGFHPPDDWEPPHFQFTRGPPPNGPQLSPEHRQVIAALAEYAEHSPAGSTRHILTTHFGLSFDEAYDVLAASSSTQDAMLRGFAQVAEQERESRLREAAKAVAQDYDSIHHDERLQAFWSQMPPDNGNPSPPDPLRPDQPPPPGPTTGGGGSMPKGGPSDNLGPNAPGGGGHFPSAPTISGPAPAPRRSTGNPLPTNEVTTHYTSFVEEKYGRAHGGGGGGVPRINFRMAASQVRGFGGVMFGNTVTGPKNLRVATVRWVPVGTDGEGALEFTLSDGSTAQLPGVRSDVAFVARSLVFAPPTGLEPPKRGEGIGLVGIEIATPESWPVTNIGSKVPDFASCYDLVIHPALADTEIGWCIIGLDSLPIVPAFLSTQAHRWLSAPAAAGLDALWSDLTATSATTWRIVDVPLEVTISTEGPTRTVQLRRTVDGPESYPEGLRATAFLEMWPILRQSNDEQAENIAELSESVKKLGGAAKRLENEGKRADAGMMRRMSGTLRTSLNVARGRLKTMQDVGKIDNVDRTFAAEFYRHLPQLCQVSADYAGANNLARVVASLRWASDSGAKFPADGLVTPARVATPEMVLLSDRDGVSGKNFADDEDPTVALEADALQNLEVLAGDDPDLQSLVQAGKKSSELNRQLTEVLEKLRTASDKAEMEATISSAKDLSKEIEAQNKAVSEIAQKLIEGSPVVQKLRQVEERVSTLAEQGEDFLKKPAKAEKTAVKKARVTQLADWVKQMKAIQTEQARLLDDAKRDRVIVAFELLSMLR